MLFLLCILIGLVLLIAGGSWFAAATTVGWIFLIFGIVTTAFAAYGYNQIRKEQQELFEQTFKRL
jgi:hypothetical protein